MGTYIIRRVLWGILLLILVSALTFVIFNVLPSANPAVLRAGRNSSPAVIAHIAHELGTDQPIYTQFFTYMKNIFFHSRIVSPRPCHWPSARPSSGC
jgi:peptide/nickel transport system permease protein